MLKLICNNRIANRSKYGTLGCVIPAFTKTRIVPVEIVQITNFFITLKILPHYSKDEDCLGLSKPYNVAIDIDDFKRNEVALIET